MILADKVKNYRKNHLNKVWGIHTVHLFSKTIKAGNEENAQTQMLMLGSAADVTRKDILMKTKYILVFHI